MPVFVDYEIDNDYYYYNILVLKLCRIVDILYILSLFDQFRYNNKI